MIKFLITTIFITVSCFAEPITHTVFFKLKHASGSPEALRFYAEAQKLSKIPGVEDFRWVEETSAKNQFDYGLTMQFADQSAYDFYNAHPVHVRFVEEVWIPNVLDFKEVDWVSDSWKTLLDSELSKWEVWTGVPHESVVGLPAGVVGQPDVTNGVPIGKGDPLGLFSVDEEGDELILKVTGQVYAGLTSLESFSDYHLTLEVKWGSQKWEPRLQAKRDSGLLYHCYGEHGSFWNVWKSCLELQIQEGDMGDLFQLAGPRSSFTADSDNVWDPSAKLIGHGGRVIRSADNESPYGEWTRIDLFVLADRAVHVVNGDVVLVLQDAKDDLGNPLIEGQLQLQSEAAEVYYRDIRIRPIRSFPEDYSRYFK
ncbi:MAG: family 16 glycoside hydrolase [Coraliomargaritaceae bacterium]